MFPFKLSMPSFGEEGDESGEIDDTDEAIPEYRGPEMKCGNCRYFEDEMCSKFEQACDFDGSCAAFEGVGDGEGDGESDD